MKKLFTMISVGLLLGACAIEGEEGDAEDEPELAEVSSASTISNCEAFVGTNNTGWARCTSGTGSYRAAATCNSNYWPYTTTVYGPWKTRTSGHESMYSIAWGNGYNCQIAKVRYQVY